MTETRTSQSRFQRQGLGYSYDAPEGFRLSLSRIKRARDGMSGHLYVESTGNGKEGPLVANKFNVDSLTARKSQASYLAGKTQGLSVNWNDLLDRFCLLVNRSELTDNPFTTIGDEEEEDLEWLVDNLIILGQPTTIFAPGGSGKSFLALGIALTLETGTTIIPGLKPRTKTRILYMDYESDKTTMNRRVRMLCRGKGLPYIPLAYRRCNLSMTDQIEDIARLVTSENIQLVIIDSVEMTLASQREGSDANASIVDLYKALRQLHVSYLLIDHVSVAETEKTKGNRRPYGSIFKTNLARLTFEIRLGSRENGAFNMGLYSTKGNDVAPINPLALQVRFADQSVYYSRHDITDDTKLTEALSQPDQIESSLKRGALTVKEISDLTNIKPNAVRSILSEHKDRRFRKLETTTAGESKWGLTAPF